MSNADTGSGLLPHQQRVVAEKQELDDRLARLNVFIHANPSFRALGEDERDRLRRQRSAMQDYCNVLAERIAAFPAA